jgi:hypothetical protein
MCCSNHSTIADTAYSGKGLFCNEFKSMLFNVRAASLSYHWLVKSSLARQVIYDMQDLGQGH